MEFMRCSPCSLPIFRFPLLSRNLQSGITGIMELIDGILRKKGKLWTGFCVYTKGVEVHVTGSDLDARTG